MEATMRPAFFGGDDGWSEMGEPRITPALGSSED